MIAVSGSAESVKPYKNHFKFMAIWRLLCCEFCAFLIAANEIGDFAGGRATAGAVAGTDEASSIIHNPASATGIKGSQLFLSAGYLSPTAEFDIEESSPLVGDNDGGSAGNAAPLASFAYVHDLGRDDWSVGISLGGLAGAGLDYNDDWVGRYQATKVNHPVDGAGTNLCLQNQRQTLSRGGATTVLCHPGPGCKRAQRD